MYLTFIHNIISGDILLISFHLMEKGDPLTHLVMFNLTAYKGKMKILL